MGMNINLFKLAEALGMGPNKGQGLGAMGPSHGYTIAENRPEVVTAPGVYFPAEKGEVLSPETYLQKNGLTPLIPRQFGGKVDPSWGITEEPSTLYPGGTTYRLPGEEGFLTVGPRTGDDEAARQGVFNSSIQAPGQARPGTYYDAHPEEKATGYAPGQAPQPNLTPPSEFNRPSEFGGPSGFAPQPNMPMPSPSPAPSMGPLMTPPPMFKENKSSPMFSSDQKAAFDKKWEPYQDMFKRMGGTSLFPRAGGGPVSPNPFDALTEEERRQYLLSSRGGEVPIAPLAAPTNVPGTPSVEPNLFSNTVSVGAPGNDEAARRGITSTFPEPNGQVVNPASYYDAHPAEREAQNIYDMLRPGRSDQQDWQDFRNRAALESSFGTPASKKAAAGALDLSQKGRIEQENIAGKAATIPFTNENRDYYGYGAGVGLFNKRTGIPVPGTAVPPKPVPEKNPTELGLIAKARELGKDGQPTPDAIEAQGQLNDLQKRKESLAQAQLDVKSKDIDINAIADAIGEGQDARVAVKGSMGNPVASKAQSLVLKKYPKFNFNMSDANYKWKQSQTNQRTINFVGGALPRVDALSNQLAALPNTDIPAINAVMRQVAIQTGKPEFTNFESNRNAIVQEINTALSGSATGSDMRIKIELENLNAARSPAQIIGAINNLREALIARIDVDLSDIYPLEVVQGKKSLEEYKKELFKKYRGKYGQEQERAGNGKTIVKQFVSPSTGKTKYVYSDGTEEIK